MFFHHSTGGNIWGPNGSSISIPQQMEIYNSTHGYSGTNAVSMERIWEPDGNNEWEFWNRIFRGQVPQMNILNYMNSNKILVIKSCFPSSEMIGRGQPSDTLTPAQKTVYNYKWAWRNIVNIMAQRPQNFFAIWTNAPLVEASTNASQAALSKEFCTWAKDTLAMGLDPVMGAFPPNVYVFDFFGKLTNPNGFLKPEYAVSLWDSHPNMAATNLIAPQFVSEIFDAAIAYEGGGSTLAVSPQSRNVPSSAGTTNFTVSSNSSWAAQSNSTWCTVTTSGSGNGTITVNYSQNSSGTSRTAIITVSVSGTSSQTVTVTQAAASSLGVNPQSQSVGSQQGNTNFSITSNTSWTGQSNATWCTVTPSGTGNGTLTANYTQNTSTSPRTASIAVSASGGPTQTVTVVQAGAPTTLSVNPTLLNVEAMAGDVFYNVTSNSFWTAQSNQIWCIPTLSGNGNESMMASYEANGTYENRTAIITISAEGASDFQVSLVQKSLFTDIQLADPQNSLKIYPNPSKGVLTIETPDALIGELEINIINTMGEKIDFQIFRTKHSTFQLKLNTASTGIHFISITNGERILTERFILQ